MSVLQFLGYKVIAMEYKRNPRFESVTGPISLEPKITTKINVYHTIGYGRFFRWQRYSIPS